MITTTAVTSSSFRGQSMATATHSTRRCQKSALGESEF